MSRTAVKKIVKKQNYTAMKKYLKYVRYSQKTEPGFDFSPE